MPGHCEESRTAWIRSSKMALQLRPALAVLAILIAVQRVAGTSYERCMVLQKDFSKTKPSPEPATECHRYRDKSCCKAGMTTSFLETNQWLNLTDYVHCSQKPKLSPACQRVFHDELCFFSCSPNIGQWIITTAHTPKRERFKNVPLCLSVCKKWWEACMGEYTCHANWYTGMDRDSQGMNTCRTNSTCKLFSEVYGNAKNFCETIWDYSFKVTPDDDSCMTFDFDPSKPNPNVAVAQRAASAANATPAGSFCVVGMLALYFTLLCIWA